MFQKIVLQQEIEAALNSKSADPVLAEKRKFGLRFIVEAKPGQPLSDVARAFHNINDRFKVEPLFPPPLFVYPEPDPALAWHNTAFVAAVEDVTFDDVSMKPWDIAHAARNEGGFARVAPDVSVLAPEPLAAGPETAAEPGPGWETATMRIKEAWAAFERRGLKLPGSNVVIGHPDCGWYPHEAWDKGNLDFAKSCNFMPNEDPRDARDPLTGAEPGHGTSTASVMVSPHGLPVVGVAPHAVVIPIRCVSTVILYPLQTELIKAITYAVQQRCRVISISLGGLFLDVFLGDAIRDAVAANVIVVAAAGQDLPPLHPTVQPAAWESFVIGVAGIEGVRTGFQRWDPSGRWPYGSIAISAPASPVYRAKAVPGSRNVYENSKGTSYATAFMAGIAALWLSYHFRDRYTGTRPAQHTFREHVQRTAQKPRGFDDWFYGVVDAEKLMTTDPLPNAKGVEDEREMDINSASQFAHLLGEANYEKANHLLSAVIFGTQESMSTEPADILEPWSGEIVAIIQGNPELRMEVSKRAESSALTAQTLKKLVAPHASDALRNQFAAAEGM